MANYKNKETGDVISIPRVRIVMDKDGNKIGEIDLSTMKNIDFTVYEPFTETTNYEAIRVTKAHGDGRGVR